MTCRSLSMEVSTEDVEDESLKSCLEDPVLGPHSEINQRLGTRFMNGRG